MGDEWDSEKEGCFPLEEDYFNSSTTQPQMISNGIMAKVRKKYDMKMRQGTYNFIWEEVHN